MKTILAQRLRAARQAIHPDVTQRDVAKRLKRSPSAVNLWESGKTSPSSEDLVELSRWYNVKTDWLLGADNIKTPRNSPKPPIYRFPSYRLSDGVHIIGRVTEVTIRRLLQ